MATTPQAFVWDFHKKIDGASELGGVTHYYSEDGQTLYLNNGLKTKTAFIDNGHWETVPFSNQIDINSKNWNRLRLDHPSNGILYGVATNGSSIEFVRYVYALNISHLMDSWSWTTQVDNSVAQFDGTLINFDVDTIMDDNGLFQPGARILIRSSFGNMASSFTIGTCYLDELSYDMTSETFDISGRNRCGYYLKDQTFDDHTNISGSFTNAIRDILNYAGLTDIVVQDKGDNHAFEFRSSDNLLDGIDSILAYYETNDHKFKVWEDPNGKIYVGRDDWLKTYAPIGYYSFDEGKEVFTRKTSKTVDGSYTHLRATGKDKDNKDLSPVTVAVNNYSHWTLGPHKTKHISAEDGKTQSELQSWAEAQALAIQYVGIGEDFSGPFRPHLLVGDIAQIKKGDVGTSLGTVTEIKQSFSRSNGFKTDFSVDSGGVTSNGEGYDVYTKATGLSGYNRKIRIIDLVKTAAETSTTSVQKTDFAEITEQQIKDIWNSLR